MKVPWLIMIWRENGSVTGSSRVRKHYADWYNKNLAYYNDAFRKSGADNMSVETTEDYAKALLKFFKAR